MTKETAYLYLPLVQALTEGKTIQHGIECGQSIVWDDVKDVKFIECPEKYRIKPEPVMIPLGPEDVPPGSVIRGIGFPEWWMVTGVAKIQINCGERTWSTYEALQKNCEIKRPGEDWMPCHKPATINPKP
jgi:hypothetical protein